MPAPTAVSSLSEAPTNEQIRRFNARINRIINQATVAEDDVLVQLRTELVAVQRDARLLAVSTQGASAQLARVGSRLDALDDALARITGSAVAAGATAGADMIDDAFNAAGIVLDVDDVDLRGLIDDKTTFANTLIHDRVGDVRARMAHQINRLATGAPVESVLSDIGEKLHGSVVFGAAARDVASMAVTAMGDAHGAGAINRGEQIIRAGGPLTLKRWVSQHRKEARPAHIRLEAATIAGVPLDEPFRLGRYSAQRPRGPGLPGVERISCRCRLGIVLTADAPIGARPQPPDAMRANRSIRGGVPAVEDPGREMASALEIIDSLHRLPDGTRKILSVRFEPQPPNRLGGYLARRMIFDPSQPTPRLTFAHEFGHYLDGEVLGAAGERATVAKAPLLRRWWQAVHASANHHELEALTLVPEQSKRYLLSRNELFARSYSQWIAVRSQDPTMLAELNRWRSVPIPYQWTDDDFEPIDRELATLLERLGLLT